MAHRCLAPAACPPPKLSIFQPHISTVNVSSFQLNLITSYRSFNLHLHNLRNWHHNYPIPIGSLQQSLPYRYFVTLVDWRLLSLLGYHHIHLPNSNALAHRRSESDALIELASHLGCNLGYLTDCSVCQDGNYPTTCLTLRDSHTSYTFARRQTRFLSAILGSKVHSLFHSTVER